MNVTRGSVQFSVGGSQNAFWARVVDGTWEPASYAVLDRFLAPDLVMVDIGAWIGPLTLYAAGLKARVQAYEPDPVARAELAANVARNPELAERVTISPLAVGPGAGDLRLGNRTSARGGDSMSSLLFADARVGWPVRSVGLTELLTPIPAELLGLVKIDIEGAEVEMLEPAAELLERCQPPLLLSVHARFWQPDPWPRLRRLADLLAGYEVLLTPDFEPFPAGRILTEPYASGLLELVACSRQCWESR
jgi:FkbM family methyltransferase